MPLQSVDNSAVVNRVKRAHGQLAGVLRMIEEGQEVDLVIPQLKAVSRALDRAAFAMITADLRRHLADGGSIDEERLADLERFVLALG
ncbi:metal-sensitive transcriptional regulator [Nocardioides sp. SYSU DS0663]|uniref:metal-sensitive transcriptional regulator n=1 Tax=Nocardioides sp. SYSU DS0663 TaxID=3416445 RepID=UPI003F4CA753